MMTQAHPDTPAISAIVTNYNGAAFLSDCIRSLLEQTLRPTEILVVDNDSTDGSQDLVRDRFPDVKLIDMGENAGFARATNAGIRKSAGDFVALLNNDATADKFWLENLMRPLRERADVGFCASKMLFSWDRSLINNAGIGITDYALPYDRGFHLPDSEEYSRDRLVFGACGGAALFRRSMLERTGLFDEDFFLCYDDADLSFRAQLMGYKCLYAANAVVYHAGGRTVPYHGETARFYSCRHFVAVIEKNLPAGILCRRLHVILWFCVKNTARSFLVHKDLVNLRGYLSGIAALKRNLRLRREIRRNTAVSAEYIRSLMSSKSRMLRETGRPASF